MKTIPVTIHFLVEHQPQTEEHLKQVARNFLRGKGIQTVPPTVDSNNVPQYVTWVEV